MISMPKAEADGLARHDLKPLLPRERQVLEGVRRGLSNQQIAEAIFVCEDTVKYHLRRIFIKLEVSRRSEALAVAVYNGLLDGFEKNGSDEVDCVGEGGAGRELEQSEAG